MSHLGPSVQTELRNQPGWVFRDPGFLPLRTSYGWLGPRRAAGHWPFVLPL